MNIRKRGEFNRYSPDDSLSELKALRCAGATAVINELQEKADEVR